MTLLEAKYAKDNRKPITYTHPLEGEYNLGEILDIITNIVEFHNKNGQRVRGTKTSLVIQGRNCTMVCRMRDCKITED